MTEPATFPDPPARSLTELEHRVERLENVVAALEDTRALEERVVDRVSQRLEKCAPALSNADRVTAAPPRPASNHDPNPLGAADPLPGIARTRHPWLLFDMVSSARLLLRMLFDRRYALAPTTHLVVWLFLPAILLSAWWFPLAWVPFVGSYLDKIFDLLLAFCIYKALSRETRRYRETLAAR